MSERERLDEKNKKKEVNYKTIHVR